MIVFASMTSNGLSLWGPAEDERNYVSGVICSGYDEESEVEDVVDVAVNARWDTAGMTLPDLPEGYCWKIAVNTGDPKQQTFAEKEMPVAQKNLLLGDRSVIVSVGGPNPRACRSNKWGGKTARVLTQDRTAQTHPS